MKLGLFGINMSACATDPDVAIRVALAAEAGGWESVWTGEHYVLPDPSVAESPARGDTPMLDPFVALAAVAACTTTLLVGTGVTVLPLHQPLALAKRVVSIDHVSHGRFLFGVGVGYLAPEFAALGVPFDRRGERTDECLDAMEAIWNEHTPDFKGQFLAFSGIRAEPRPSRVPLHFGGLVASSFRRAVRRGHGWYGWALDVPATRRAIGELREIEAEEARPSSLPPLEISITPDPRAPLDRDVVAAYADLGVTRLIVVPPGRVQRDPDELVRFVEELPGS